MVKRRKYLKQYQFKKGHTGFSKKEDTDLNDNPAPEHFVRLPRDEFDQVVRTGRSGVLVDVDQQPVQTRLLRPREAYLSPPSAAEDTKPQELQTYRIFNLGL